MTGTPAAMALSTAGARAFASVAAIRIPATFRTTMSLTRFTWPVMSVCSCMPM